MCVLQTIKDSTGVTAGTFCLRLVWTETWADTSYVFALKGEALAKYWLYTEQMLICSGADGPDNIIDDGGDANVLIHKDTRFEEKFAKLAPLADSNSITNPEIMCVFLDITDSIGVDPMQWTTMAAVMMVSARRPLPVSTF